MLAEALSKVLNGAVLTREEAKSCFSSGLSGAADPVQLAGLLVALAQRGEHIDEVLGACEALRSHMVPFEHSCPDAIDTCGTGGDGLGMFNISTAAAIVVASTGLPVVKHGNRAVSSKSGSADLLEALGIRLELSPEQARGCLEEVGITFLFAPRYHPAMRHAGPVRRSLGIRTIFNLLGPLANPGNIVRQVLGVSRAEHIPIHANVLARLGAKSAWVVHGAGGADELTLAPGNLITPVRNGSVVENLSLSLEELPVSASPVDALKGGTAAQNVSILHDILRGSPGPLRDAVTLNAGAAICVGPDELSLDEAIKRAQRAIDDGSAARLLQDWVAFCEPLS